MYFCDRRPTVGLNPTTPFMAAGQVIDPLVSVPSASGAKRAAIAAAEPDDEPHGERSRLCGFRVWPPRPLQPAMDLADLKFAHSDMLVLPRMMAPASRSFYTTKASSGGIESWSMKDPAVVGRSIVS